MSPDKCNHPTISLLCLHVSLKHLKVGEKGAMSLSGD